MGSGRVGRWRWTVQGSYVNHRPLLRLLSRSIPTEERVKVLPTSTPGVQGYCSSGTSKDPNPVTSYPQPHWVWTQSLEWKTSCQSTGTCSEKGET